MKNDKHLFAVDMKFIEYFTKDRTFQKWTVKRELKASKRARRSALEF